MSMVLIRINATQEGIDVHECHGIRMMDVPSSARLLSTLDGWKLEVPGQSPFWLPPDVQVVKPTEKKPSEGRQGL